MELAPGLEVTPSVCLVRKLGSGGMGSVWVAEHKGLRSEVVVKFMATELLKDEGSKQRFSREAAAAAQVRSPHVVQILDHGITSGGLPFIVMELLEGHDLGAHLDKVERLAPRDAVTIMNQLGKALSRAHDRGIVHRDLKPENIFLCEGDELFVKVLDFGIAKAQSEPFGVSTITGMLVGSPYYMSPEQLRALKDIDFRTDIWSIGVVMYQALTGLRPFVAENLAALAVVIHSEPAPPPSSVNPELPAEFDDWFAKACSRDRSARFASMKEMAQTMERALLPLTDVSRPPIPSGAKTGEVAVSTRAEPAALMRTTAPVSASTISEVKSDTPPTEARPASRRTLAIAGGAAALVLVAGIALVMRSSDTPTAETTAPSAASAAPATPTPSAAPPPVVEPAVIPTVTAPPVAEPAPSASVEAPKHRSETERAASRSSRPSRNDDERRKKAAPPASAKPAEAPKPAAPAATPQPPAQPAPAPAPTSRERPI